MPRGHARHAAHEHLDDAGGLVAGVPHRVLHVAGLDCPISLARRNLLMLAAQHIVAWARVLHRDPTGEVCMTFEEFAAARLPGVLRFAAVLTGDRGLAEDVVQEVLIRANGRWQAIAGLDRPEAYIRKMIVNEYLSWRRRSWRLVPSGAGTDVDDRLTPDAAADYADREAILAELAKLPRRQRSVLVLRYYEGLSDTEIAAAIGCTPGTVRGYACRALAVLRVELAEPPLQIPIAIKEER
jgi:RNA polymerase sigma-70 factor (sigma-E family)